MGKFGFWVMISPMFCLRLAFGVAGMLQNRAGVWRFHRDPRAGSSTLPRLEIPLFSFPKSLLINLGLAIQASSKLSA